MVRYPFLRLWRFRLSSQQLPMNNNGYNKYRPAD